MALLSHGGELIRVDLDIYEPVSLALWGMVNLVDSLFVAIMYGFGRTSNIMT